jgi:CRP-like cAMP-binding protein
MDDRAADVECDSGGGLFTSPDRRVDAPSQRAEIERGNRLLHSLEGQARDLLLPHLEHTMLSEGQVLEVEGQRSTFLYFPTKGGISLEAGPDRASLQLALVGRESLIGASLLLGGIPISRAVVQFQGAAWRVPADALGACLEKSPHLHRQLLLGVNALVGRLSRAAWANGRIMIEHRLANWLLTAADCLDADHIPVTHQALSNALGVRRPSVTIAMHALEESRAVRSRRGHISILDRQRLVAAAGDGFRAPIGLQAAPHGPRKADSGGARQPATALRRNN